MKALPAIFLLLAILPARVLSPDSARANSVHLNAPVVARDYSGLPLSFEINRGQTSAAVRYLTHIDGYAVFLTSSEAVFVGRTPGPQSIRGSATSWALRRLPQVRVSRQTTAIRMRFDHANPHPRIVGLDRLPGVANYFVGNNPTHWRTDIPTFARVEYQNLYPGINLVFYGRGRQLEYDWVLRPAARLSSVRLRIQGAPGVAIHRAGDLVLPSLAGAIVQRAPRAYQRVDGAEETVNVRYALGHGGQVGFTASKYDVNRPLRIDPVVAFATYLGGREAESGYAVAVDGSLSAYAVGDTVSNDFPLKNNLKPIVFASNTPSVGFITKFDPTGTQLVYSTYFGGSNFTHIFGIAVDGQNDVFFAGETGAQDYPVLHPFQRFYGGGGSDAVITELSAAGDKIVYSSYLGGSDNDAAYAIAVDHAGNAYIAGSTASKDFEVRKALQPKIGGGVDAFVAEVSTAGKLLWNTYLGGAQLDSAFGVAVDAAGNIYVAGETQSPDFPVVNAIQTQLKGASDGFVTKIDPTGQKILYSTHIGGGDNNIANSIAVDAVGDAFITGQTSSTDFPTRNAFQPHYGGQGASYFYGDAYVTKLDPSGQLVYSTFLGGHYDDEGRFIAVDLTGAAYVTGETDSADFPIKDAVQPAFQSAPCRAINGKPYPCTDAFITKLDASGALVWSTFWGGSKNSTGTGIAVDSSGAVYAIGTTESRDMITAGAIHPANISTQTAATDAYVLKLTPGATTHDGTSIVIDKLQLLHKVGGRMLSTSAVRTGENVEFVVAFHDKRHGSHLAVGTLIVWRGKKEIEQATMLTRGTARKPLLVADLSFAKSDGTGSLQAEFEIISNPASTAKSVRFSIAAR
jgi:hypothetical protein